MYKVLNAVTGDQLSVGERKVFIRLHENGCYVECPEEEAQGVAVDSTPYNLNGRTPMGELPSVELETFDGAGALLAAQAENASFIQLIRDARAGLATIPTNGEAWGATHRYIAGDTVVYEGANYTALRFSHGKQPDVEMAYWELAPAEETIAAWTSIEDGTIIHEGDRVTYDGTTWICAAQHFKSLVFKPKAGSSKWETET